MEQISVNQRLNLIVDSFENGKKASFARKAGISPQGAQELLAGRKGDPSFKVLVKILEAYPQVKADWLVLGHGVMSVASEDSVGKEPLTTSSIELDYIVQQIKATQSEQSRAIAYLHKEPNEVLEAQSNYFVVYGELHLIRSEISNAITNKHPESEIMDLRRREAVIQARASVAEAEFQKHNLKNELTKREAQLAVYHTGTNPDIGKPFGGLLHYRLGITPDLSNLLAKSNKIRSVEIEGGYYSVTEQAVREFLDEI